jgi:hypothetical protein
MPPGTIRLSVTTEPKPLGHPRGLHKTAATPKHAERKYRRRGV